MLSPGLHLLLWLPLLLHFCICPATSGAADEQVAGPIVKLKDNSNTGAAADATNTTAAAEEEKPDTLAAIIDQVLQKEFTKETNEDAKSGAQFNATVQQDEAKLETVVRISSTKTTTADDDSSTGNSTAADSGSSGGGSATSATAEDDPNPNSGNSGMESGVDRIIDSQDNEFVLSRPKESVASLTIDPQLIQDISAVLITAAMFGTIFEAIRQPVINGYLIAGALVGPGGLNLVKELVQVESLAQLGVQLLLFGLGLELSLTKLRAVWGVAVMGGSLQILLSMVLGGMGCAIVGTPVGQGIFVGALVAMSSTSVVVKCLDVMRSANTPYGQITVGTLILQDCMVGLMFALLPVFKPAPALHAPPAAGTAPDSDVAEAKGRVVIMVLTVLLKLSMALLTALVLARTVLPPLLRLLQRNATTELNQLSIVAWCFFVAWLSNSFGLSSELGAFVAGAMVSIALGGHGQQPAAGGGAAVATMAPSPGGGGAHGPDAEDNPGAHFVYRNTESVRNVLVALFMASIGLIMSPRFLLDHLGVLTAGTLFVLVVKASLVAGVVRAFSISPRTALAVGLSMAHIGEFGFVLMSSAVQHDILPMQVYMFLIGVTALSLLTTPFIVLLAMHWVLPKEPGLGLLTPMHKARGSSGSGVGAGAAGSLSSLDGDPAAKALRPYPTALNGRPGRGQREREREVVRSEDGPWMSGSSSGPSSTGGLEDGAAHKV